MSGRYLSVAKWVVFFFFLFLFLYKTVTFVDPDLGWHLAAGAIVAETGTAPTNDPWTYTMYGHEWIDHEWLVDGILYAAQKSGNWALVQVTFFLLAFLPLLYWLVRAKHLLSLVFVVLAGHVLVDVIGVRPQMLSFFLFFLLFEILWNKRLASHKATLFFLPLFFLLWANLHGGFPVGLMLWGALLGTRTFILVVRREMPFRQYALEWSSFGASLLTTLGTPYGTSLWLEIIHTASTPLLREIIEWQWSFVHWPIALPLFVGAGAGLLLVFARSLQSSFILSAGVFLLLGVKHARMAPFLFVAALPLIEQALALFSEKIAAHKNAYTVRWAADRLAILSVFLLLIAAATSRDRLIPYHPPYDAIAALKRIETVHPGRVFNEYGFGGALILDDPKRTLFIDGRMPHWNDESGYSAFTEYLDVHYKEGRARAVFDKYGITIVIVRQTDSARMQNREERLSALPPFVKNTVKFLFPLRQAFLLTELHGAGWCTVYRDTEALILVAPGSRLCTGGSAH